VIVIRVIKKRNYLPLIHILPMSCRLPNYVHNWRIKLMATRITDTRASFSETISQELVQRQLCRPMAFLRSYKKDPKDY
jgi:hypothetical protein